MNRYHVKISLWQKQRKLPQRYEVMNSMTYENIIKQFGNKIFSRNDLFEALRSENPELSYNSFKWIVAQLIEKKLIYRVDYNSYSQSENVSRIYIPLYSEGAKKIKQEIEEEYPLADFCIFESYLLNEFLNHQIANNTIVVQMEKELGGFLFDYLQEKYKGRVLYKPDQESLQRYWSENCIIIVDRISEAPKDKQKPHDMIIEKLLVDIFAEMVIRNLFSPSEYPDMVEMIMERYHVDNKKMLRYAKRRNAVDKISKYLK